MPESLESTQRYLPRRECSTYSRSGPALFRKPTWRLHWLAIGSARTDPACRIWCRGGRVGRKFRKALWNFRSFSARVARPSAVLVMASSPSQTFEILTNTRSGTSPTSPPRWQSRPLPERCHEEARCLEGPASCLWPSESEQALVESRPIESTGRVA